MAERQLHLLVHTKLATYRLKKRIKIGAVTKEQFFFSNLK